MRGFDETRNYEPLEDEVQLHTWRSATLREITNDIIKAVVAKESQHGTGNADSASPTPQSTAGNVALPILDATPSLFHSVQNKHARFGFVLVFPDKRGRFMLARRAGVIFANKETENDSSTLADIGLEPGDFIDVAITFEEKAD